MKLFAAIALALFVQTLSGSSLHAQTKEPAAHAKASRTAAQAEPTVVDINTASATELCSLPGIGPALAERIIEARKRKPFQEARDLRRVKGIGFRTLAKLKPLIRMGPQTRVLSPTPKRGKRSKAKQ